ncbi:hypothetical protein A3H85_03560 [Candidatus Daviesbacteria bacterium RIFCSPLOWO2_02_FULL_40_8]|uniref:Uncharacterized protein n=1 Tax=Candidatus Daviesbacteria bacterium RIFCSPLOWO2_01_FULL_40_24 TaxID=1797787 RepID=A0A1F5MIV9_9BACT|nr:MAG: hypothetical protein A2780_03550 [Candidatus Daviesbacteria bacterium RIFCSPHIGHO2_01_FULL_41_45]OGE35544.1 MAG: hypothetical protein A3C32_02990 [Candidatus Daviesbacteria bacterium RIFCSPHIGHO2_02_FULL_41_14]OGE65293.1 MAG: hypothetical protein A3B49_00325 [Candidatus Daviesbacteria bacterium RIFCSPLOWO2_01_FULL_40_24]OGE66941.1 MAG: hypothetical protein A3H85_03560 [Candidatus Daviesbacteria bacterium RIFCSPLOWO2_02_FULL_40_8]
MDEITAKIKLYFGKNRQTVITSLVTLSSFVILGLVIIPQLLSYFTVQDEILQINKKTEELGVKAVELEKVDLISSQNSLGVVSSILPAEPDVPFSITVLQGLVIKSGLLLDEIAYLPSVAEKKSFILSVKVSGSLQNIRSFILELKNASRVFQIETISLKSVAGQKIEAEIPVSVHYGAVSAKKTVSDGMAPDLTDEEKALLQRLQSLASPVSITSGQSVKTVDIPTGKSDPFE